MFSTTAVLLLFAELVLTQFVAKPSNFTTKTGYAGINVRYKEVPTGICETDPDVKSYSGYADVAQDQHIFWWFFEAREVDPTTAPLTLWINGGPGSSSMIGLFQELGPCGVDINGNVYSNPYSYSNVSNLLVIDQPTTTGFSYSIPVPGFQDPYSGLTVALAPNASCPDYADPTTCGTYNSYNLTLTANSTVAAAPNFYLTLQAFTGAFPQYASNGVFFATESYGGHYGPIFSRYIVEQNELNTTGTGHIDLRATLIGNGWLNPILQYAAYYNFTSQYSVQRHEGGNSYGIVYNQSYDDYVYNNMYGPYNCLDMLLDCNSYAYATNTSDGQGNEVCANADSWCYSQVEYPFDIYFGRDEYDIRYLTPDPFPYEFYVDYLNTAEVQAAIGAYTNFSESSSITGNAFAATGDDAREIGVTEAVEYLLDHNVTIALYFGDADYVCNWFGGEAFAYTLNNIPLWTDDTAGFVNISSSDNVVHGAVKAAGPFSFVRVYESGHEVPFYQPLLALEILNRTIHGYDIATGTVMVTANYTTNGTMDSTFVDGNSTVAQDIIPTNATYNTTTNEPNPPYNTSAILSSRSMPNFMTRLDRRRMDMEIAGARAAEGMLSNLDQRTSVRKERNVKRRQAPAFETGMYRGVYYS